MKINIYGNDFLCHSLESVFGILFLLACEENIECNTMPNSIVARSNPIHIGLNRELDTLFL